MHKNLGREVARVVFGPHPGVTPLSKAMARGLLWTAVLAWVVGAGCSGKSTGPAAVKKLPAMSLFESPIADSSATYPWPAEISEQDEDSVSFPDSAIEALGRVDDIYLRYLRPENCFPFDVSVYRSSTQDWVTLETWRGGGPCFGGFESSWWLLSSFDTDPADRFLNGDRILLLQGTAWSVQATLLRYRDDYAFVVTSSDSRPWYEGLAFDGKSLWTTAGVGGGDSLFVFDLAGNRTRAQWLPGARIAAMVWGGEDFWVVLSGNPPRMARMSEDGTITVAFTIPDEVWDNVRGGVAWVDSLLWVPRIAEEVHYRPVMEFIAMDPEASIASGIGVVVEQYSAPEEFRDMVGITSRDGDFIVTATSPWYGSLVFRMARDGTVDEGQPLQIGAGPIAWDGESLWMLHSGPAIPSTGGSMLSRFNLD